MKYLSLTKLVMISFFTMLITITGCSSYGHHWYGHHHNHMMSSTDSQYMMGMMHECMGMYHDETTCDKKVMTSCQENMGRQECGKIMSQVKDQDKALKTVK